MLIGLGKMIKKATSALNLLASRVLGYTSVSGSGSGYYGASIVERIGRGFLLTNYYAPPSYSTDLLKTNTVSPGNGLTPGVQYGDPVAGNGYFLVVSSSGASSPASYAYSKDAINWTVVQFPVAVRQYLTPDAYFHQGKFFISADQYILVGSDPTSMTAHYVPTSDGSPWSSIFIVDAGSAPYSLHLKSTSQIVRWNTTSNSFNATAAAPAGFQSLGYTAGHYIAYKEFYQGATTVAYRMSISSILDTWEEIQIPWTGQYISLHNNFWIMNNSQNNTANFIIGSSNAGTTWVDLSGSIDAVVPNLANSDLFISVQVPNQSESSMPGTIFINGYDPIAQSYKSYLGLLYADGTGVNGSGLLEITSQPNYLVSIIGSTYYFNTNEGILITDLYSGSYIHRSFPFSVSQYIKNIDNTYLAVGYNTQSPGGYIEVYSSTSPTFDTYEVSEPFMGDYYTWSKPVTLENMTTYVEVQASIGNQTGDTVEVLAPVDVYVVPAGKTTTLTSVTVKNTSLYPMTFDYGYYLAGESMTDANAGLNDQLIQSGETQNITVPQFQLTSGMRIVVLPSSVDSLEVKVYGTES